MKIIILTIFCVCLNMNMYAQKFFSKMFDFNYDDIIYDLKRKYAKFLVEGCLRLKKGDKLFIIGYNLFKKYEGFFVEKIQ